MADFAPIPQFLVGWTLALFFFVFCSFWQETFTVFVALAYFYLSVAGACCLLAIHPGLFACVFVYICLLRFV
ncbi:uncharacterized protein F4812DRAFT_428029 [Daldinia caldariorum]|uniref:uncharacterized protein n=1 Tax=Daldinia caldariorum TaxID=326644 RepID=UPI002007722A|nr:uncharacterized protein F4812DRAFT_428029 [Daldinia caldariorum]KAI1467893.1 hypothetical protein F4812DRAFT_428029 [Daldinia caldariorum]